VVGVLAGFVPSLQGLLGGNGRQITFILFTTIPSVAFVLLLQRLWRGTASPVDLPLLICVGSVRIAAGLASGWLGVAISFGVGIVALYVLTYRRIPWVAVTITIASILFLQVGKAAFRSEFWGEGNTNASVWERGQFWLNASYSSWMDALTGREAMSANELVSKTMRRTSLLTQVAHVLDVTPSQVPFQDGQTYGYFVVSLIPRFVWPDKPNVNEANRFYQLAFGLSDRRSVEATSISVGSMAEGYINFGWTGVVTVMFGIGLFLKIYEDTFLRSLSNDLLVAIGIALLFDLFAVEGQLGQYLGGVMQKILLSFLVFLPVTRIRTRAFAPARFERVAVRVRG
jgi:hypothetical protein